VTVALFWVELLRVTCLYHGNIYTLQVPVHRPTPPSISPQAAHCGARKCPTKHVLAQYVAVERGTLGRFIMPRVSIVRPARRLLGRSSLG